MAPFNICVCLYVLVCVCVLCTYLHVSQAEALYKYFISISYKVGQFLQGTRVKTRAKEM